MNKRYVLITGTALGAGLMYFLDPISGKRRRAYTRDKMTHLAKETDTVGWPNRTRISAIGIRALWLRRKCCGPKKRCADDVLADRVRTVLGRVISHPGSVDVTAEHGWITLTGAILASDEKPLLHRVRAVRGVRGVQSNLESL